MTDYEDDWMNPKPSQSYTATTDKKKYLILRKRRVMVSGPSAYINQWDRWSSYETKTERDTALEKLRNDHPNWRLKAYDKMHWDI